MLRGFLLRFPLYVDWSHSVRSLSISRSGIELVVDGAIRNKKEKSRTSTGSDCEFSVKCRSMVLITILIPEDEGEH